MSHDSVSQVLHTPQKTSAQADSRSDVLQHAPKPITLVPPRQRKSLSIMLEDCTKSGLLKNVMEPQTPEMLSRNLTERFPGGQDVEAVAVVGAEAVGDSLRFSNNDYYYSSDSDCAVIDDLPTPTASPEPEVTDLTLDDYLDPTVQSGDKQSNDIAENDVDEVLPQTVEFLPGAGNEDAGRDPGSSCGYCLEEVDQMTDPRAMPCGHFFCRPCLEADNRDLDVISCVVCRYVALSLPACV